MTFLCRYFLFSAFALLLFSFLRGGFRFDGNDYPPVMASTCHLFDVPWSPAPPISKDPNELTLLFLEFALLIVPRAALLKAVFSASRPGHLASACNFASFFSPRVASTHQNQLRAMLRSIIELIKDLGFH